MSRFTKRHGKYAIQIGGVTKRGDEAFEKFAQFEDLEEQGFKMVNIDKVVEQLEKETFIASVNGGCDEQLINLEDAIKIVKGGTNV